MTSRLEKGFNVCLFDHYCADALRVLVTSLTRHLLPFFFFLYSSICLSLIFKSFYLLPEPPIFSDSPRFVYLSPQCKYGCDKNVCDRTSPFLITKPLNSLIFKTIIGTRWYFCCAIFSSPPPCHFHKIKKKYDLISKPILNRLYYQKLFLKKFTIDCWRINAVYAPA